MANRASTERGLQTKALQNEWEALAPANEGAWCERAQRGRRTHTVTHSRTQCGYSAIVLHTQTTNRWRRWPSNHSSTLIAFRCCPDTHWMSLSLCANVKHTSFSHIPQASHYLCFLLYKKNPLTIFSLSLSLSRSHTAPVLE